MLYWAELLRNTILYRAVPYCAKGDEMGLDCTSYDSYVYENMYIYIYICTLKLSVVQYVILSNNV